MVNIPKVLSFLGYKFIRENNGELYYQKFGKVNIQLKFDSHTGHMDFSHDHDFPEPDLLQKKKSEILEENTDIDNLTTKLTNFILDCAKDEEEEFKDDLDDEDNEDEDNDYNTITAIPDVKHDNNRKLFIVVWGRRIRKSVPAEYKIEKNFNAAVLHGKKAGVDWRQSGKSEEVRKAVMKGSAFPSFIESMVTIIEKENLFRISINCAKGRHRSVTCAIVLHKYYYPRTEIKYLEIK